MDAGPLLVRLAIVLVAARLAGELAERVHQPPVLAEIAAGVLIGPSVLGLVAHDGVVEALGEMGAILLLLEVGMHIDVGELARVGKASVRVALIGIAVPMALAFPMLRAMDEQPRTALFLAAAITATSVGITARVFADLRALHRTEARIVLGAAVADDVAGLLLLTVVAGMASGGGFDAMSLLGTVGGATAFLALGLPLAFLIGGRPLSWLLERARGEAAPLVAVVAIALGFAGAAASAHLAPIVGAFVAGLALGRSPARTALAERVEPVGHLLVPVFFVGIGLATDVRAFADPAALGIAGALITVAVAGKLASGLGAGRAAQDKLLVGIAMVPRGEVGLIFAALGLSSGALDARTHAALLLVVMASTVITPPWLRARIARRAHRSEAEPAAGVLPAEA